MESGVLMTHESICPEKARLVAAYDRATWAYSNAVAELQRTMGTLSKFDYDAQYRMIEALRHDAMAAQKSLEEHVSAHGC
jgi:hypothetical protein